MLALGSPLSRLVGLQRPIDFREIDWLTSPRVQIPMLVIHSAGDPDVPLQLTRKFAGLGPNRTLVEFPAVPHCAEFNAYPELFNVTIRDWHTTSTRARA